MAKKAFRAEGKRPRAEPSQAENLSAQAMARASSARAHHYYLAVLQCTTIIKIGVQRA